nr:MAG TPA: hypothetical protein [Caudoviricetes sp.]
MLFTIPRLVTPSPYLRHRDKYVHRALGVLLLAPGYQPAFPQLNRFSDSLYTLRVGIDRCY